MAQVTKDTLIGEALMMNMNIAEILMESGMHCVGCPASQGESIEEACAVHGMEVQPLIYNINDFLSKNYSKRGCCLTQHPLLGLNEFRCRIRERK